MIISRAPVRITLGGGGTDLRSYYSKYGGFLIGGAINRHVYICLNKRFFTNIRLAYSATETVDHVDDIKHAGFRECLKMLGVDTQIEIASVADVPSSCGLGTSSTFTVALLNALHTYKREFLSLQELAEEACTIEIERLGEPIGKQDQYMAAFGGITCLTFDRDGTVHVEPLRAPPSLFKELEHRIVMFYTGVERKAGEILSHQGQKTEEDDRDTVERLHKIKEIGLETRRAFEAGDLDGFGELLDVHWNTKKSLSANISNDFFDECYDTARKNGALGGKLMGAGGGGFFMFYAPHGQQALTAAMEKLGLVRTYFRFDFNGAKIVANMERPEFW